MEVLLNNPVVLIVLIAIISSLFKNRNKEAKRQRKEVQRPLNRKHAQRSSKTFTEVKEIFKEVTNSLPNVSAPKVNEAYGKKKRETEQSKAAVDENQPAITLGEKTKKEEKLREQPVFHSQESDRRQAVNEKTLADAVIWSEILGPPRAKNPYLKTRK